MNFDEYTKEAHKTVPDRFDLAKEDQNILHAVVGISTESGEMLDALKKHMFQGRELDRVNLKEEIGDIMWYISLLLGELNLKLEDVLEVNIKKLRARYGEKFDVQKSENRNLEAEREILEKN